VINAEQQKRVNELCKLIAVEKDAAGVVDLACELNLLLEEKALPSPRTQKLIFKICPLFPTNHPAWGLANPTAQ
jgi:hypothetical protein